MNNTLAQKDTLLLDEDLIEKGFNDALEGLQKSLGTRKLSKANETMEDEDEPEEDEDDDAEDEKEEDDEEEYKKSLPEILSEDPEAAAAMDVEPFLVQFAKAVDESIQGVYEKVKTMEKLVKSQAQMIAASAQLQKSTRDLVKSIGDIPATSNSVKRLQKARFEGSDDVSKYVPADILSKSRDWVKTNKMDLVESGIVEGRINKGKLFAVGDRIDQKVAALMKEAG